MSGAPDSNETHVTTLLETTTLSIRDIRCSGGCRHRSPEECAATTHLVFPYRGAFMRHVGTTETVGEANQLVFFNEDEDYAISHPVTGGDACLSIAIDPVLLRELAPPDQLDTAVGVTRFDHARRGIDPQTQAFAAQLRHGLSRGTMETLEAETLALALIRCALGDRVTRDHATTYGRDKLVSRAKLTLSANPGRRWTLAAIAGEVGVSPVYLTQVFAQVENVPLYRYQLRLRLARALDLLGDCEDLTMLALDLGFSSHSHFSAAFRQHFEQTPAEFQRSVRLR